MFSKISNYSQKEEGKMMERTGILRTNDVIIGIISYFPEFTKRISNSKFQTAIYLLKKRSRNHQDLFSGLAFATNHSVPYSESLEQVLSTLGMSGLLGRNCNWTWHVTDALKNYYHEKLKQGFTLEEQRAIQRMGRRLAEKIERGELASHR